MDAKHNRYQTNPWHAGKPVTFIGEHAFRNRTKITSITIPSTVTGMSCEAFQNCTGLTSVTTPKNVDYLGEDASENYSTLKSAIFLRDALTDLDKTVFLGTAPEFTVYFLSGNPGFTTPVWNGYPSIEIDGKSLYLDP